MTVKVTYILRITSRHVDHEAFDRQREYEKHGFMSTREYWLPDICHKVVIEGKDFADCDEQMRAYTRAFREKDIAYEVESKNFADKYSFDYTYEVMPSGCENE